jgi:hypothetical protein
MRDYLVEVEAYIPYPVHKTIRVQAGSMHTAAARAIKEYRAKHVKKGKRIDRIALTVEVLK